MLPARWDEALRDAETQSLSRSFNRPPRLDPQVVDRVTLLVRSPQQIERIAVNGQAVASGDNVLALLEPANRLAVSLRVHDAAAIILEAALEVVERGE